MLNCVHANRVTRLGKFSSIGWLFSVPRQFLKITEVAHIVRLNFYHGKIYVSILTKNGLGYILYILYILAVFLNCLPACILAYGKQLIR
jgi:hypothetical protein